MQHIVSETHIHNHEGVEDNDDDATTTAKPRREPKKLMLASPYDTAATVGGVLERKEKEDTEPPFLVRTSLGKVICKERLFCLFVCVTMTRQRRVMDGRGSDEWEP